MELVGHDNQEMSQHYTRVGRTALEVRQEHFLTFGSLTGSPEEEGPLRFQNSARN